MTTVPPSQVVLQKEAAKQLACLASALMAVGVLLGAFGAHGLKSFATPYQLDIWQTATLYLFIHTIALFVVAAACHVGYAHKKHAAPFLIGITLFCCSLYAMALGAPRMLGALTPIGGLCFVIGWLSLAWRFKLR